MNHHTTTATNSEKPARLIPGTTQRCVSRRCLSLRLVSPLAVPLAEEPDDPEVEDALVS